MFFRSACQYQRTLAMIIEYHFLSGAFSQVSLRARLDRRASGAFHGVSSELGGDMRRRRMRAASWTSCSFAARAACSSASCFA